MTSNPTARTWLITRNISELEELDPYTYLRDLFEKTKARYVVGQLERGKNTNRDHIQAFANYESSVRQTWLKAYCSKANLTIVRVNNGADTYCMKTDTRVDGPWQFGEKPKKRNSAFDWNEIYMSAKKGLFDEIPTSILLRHYGNLQKIRKDNLEIKDSSHMRGIFIYGVSGIGKSTLIPMLFPDYKIYRKPHNKWFDGYNGEELIVWDDIKPDEVQYHVTNFKLWTDSLAVSGEIKGGSVFLNHKYFIFTSQYSFKDCFATSEDYDAMYRRTFVYHMFINELGLCSQFDHSAMVQKLHDIKKPDHSKFIKGTHENALFELEVYNLISN